MRYWSYFAAKLVAAAAVLYGLLAILNWKYPPAPRLLISVERPQSAMLLPAPANAPSAILATPPDPAPATTPGAAQLGGKVEVATFLPPRFGYDLEYTLFVLVWFLLCSGALYLSIWDQRYRCRVCLRRLRMPVETG